MRIHPRAAAASATGAVPPRPDARMRIRLVRVDRDARVYRRRRRRDGAAPRAPHVRAARAHHARGEHTR
eukprot:2693516-Prymnesium_polylepis.2